MSHVTAVICRGHLDGSPIGTSIFAYVFPANGQATSSSSPPRRFLQRYFATQSLQRHPSQSYWHPHSVPYISLILARYLCPAQEVTLSFYFSATGKQTLIIMARFSFSQMVCFVTMCLVASTCAFVVSPPSARVAALAPRTASSASALRTPAR